MLIASSLLVLLSAGDAGAESFRIRGRVLQHASHCLGGVRITEAMEARLPPPAPLAGQALLVLPGEEIRAVRPTQKVVADDSGRIAVSLPAGTWCVFAAERRLGAEEAARLNQTTKAPTAARDPDCLERERRRCDAIWTVRRDATGFDVHFHQRCPQAWHQPCYDGPSPP